MIPFTKVESIGNDFVLLEETKDERRETSALGKLAGRLCERRFGVGSDGLLIVEQAEYGLSMRMFNPDGTEDFCGNGLRCAAVYAREKGWVGEQFTIFHGGRRIPVRMDGSNVATVLGVASFDPVNVPMKSTAELFRSEYAFGGRSFLMSSLTTGSTHTVLEVDELPEDDFFEGASASIETLPMFPDRTSVIWSRSDGDDTLTIRIWERGVGETYGCGTGSSAAAVVQARKLGRGGAFQVHNPGGTVEITLERWDAPITVLGTARVVFEGETDLGA